VSHSLSEKIECAFLESESNPTIVMKLTHLLAVACSVACGSNVIAGTIDFENVPNTFLGGPNGGNQDLAGFFQGITFGAGAQAIHTSTVFPAHSGVQELFPSQIQNGSLTFTFASPQTEVSFFYTTVFGLMVTAFDSNHNPISTVNEPANVVNNVGADSFLDISHAGIQSVTITDTGGLGTFFTIDDLTAPGISSVTVSDSASTLALLGLAGAGLFTVRRKFAIA
jgi:hypothetical protein